MQAKSGYSPSSVRYAERASGIGGPTSRAVVAPVAHRHHWTVYLLFASLSLFVAGLASDSRFHQLIRDWLIRR